MVKKFNTLLVGFCLTSKAFGAGPGPGNKLSQDSLAFEPFDLHGLELNTTDYTSLAEYKREYQSSNLGVYAPNEDIEPRGTEWNVEIGADDWPGVASAVSNRLLRRDSLEPRHAKSDLLQPRDLPASAVAAVSEWHGCRNRLKPRDDCAQMTQTVEKLNQAAADLNEHLSKTPVDATSWHKSAVNFMRQQIIDFRTEQIKTPEGKADMQKNMAEFKQMYNKDAGTTDDVKNFDVLYKYIKETYNDDPLFPKRDLARLGEGRATRVRYQFMSDLVHGLDTMRGFEADAYTKIEALGKEADGLLKSNQQGGGQRMIESWYRQNWRSQFRFDKIENGKDFIDEYFDHDDDDSGDDKPHQGTQEAQQYQTIRGDPALDDLIKALLDDKQDDSSGGADDTSGQKGSIQPNEIDGSFEGSNNMRAFVKVIAKLERSIELKRDGSKLKFELKKAATSGRGRIYLGIGIFTTVLAAVLLSLGFTGNLKEKRHLPPLVARSTGTNNTVSTDDLGIDTSLVPGDGANNSTSYPDSLIDQIDGVMGPQLARLFEAVNGLSGLEKEFDLVLFGLGLIANSSVSTLASIVAPGVANTSTTIAS